MRFGLFVTGVMSIVAGAVIWINKGGTLYFVPMPRYIGIVFMSAGLYCFVVAFFIVKKKLKYICCKCEKVIICYGGENNLCDICGGQLEPISGFYSRHPDKRNRK